MRALAGCAPVPLGHVGTRGRMDAWGAQYQAHHEAARTSDVNAHFRAMAWIARQAPAGSCGRACTAAEVLAARRATYGGRAAFRAASGGPPRSPSSRARAAGRRPRG